MDNIVIFGAGNVGSALARGIVSKGYNVVDIISRSGISAGKLKDRLNIVPVGSLTENIRQADLVIIATPDDEIPGVISRLPGDITGIAAHTSGSVGLDVFGGKIKSHGVIYPLQTFNPERDPGLDGVPFCIEGSDSVTLERISAFVSSLSGRIYALSSGQRRIAHLSAVFASNFSNLMYDIAFSILETNNLPAELIRPLIKETALRVMAQSPGDVQTGPAARMDVETIRKHLDMLSGREKHRELYEKISRLIIFKHTGKDVEL